MPSPSLFFRHLDQWFALAIAQYGTAIYGILFGIVFCETGLVVLPFLPGDSLLFTAGAFSNSSDAAAGNGLSLPLLYALFFAAALLGDNVNYAVGRNLGRRLFQSESSRVFRKANLVRTEEFYTRHGTKAVIMARFVPIVRTFSPFVAGMGGMPYRRFLGFSMIGAALWVGLCVTCGHAFGSIPWVKGNFEKVVIGVVVLSLVPILVEYLNHRRRSGGAPSASS